MSKYAPILRIFVRYFAGFLMAKGWVDAHLYTDIVTDPAAMGALVAGVESLIAIAMVAVTEWWYGTAKRRGGAT